MEENNINTALEKVVTIVGGVGGTAFTLAIMVIALVIIFGSVSAAKMRTVWIALISCIAGAFIFFSAAWFSSSIAEMGISKDGSPSFGENVENEHYYVE